MGQAGLSKRGDGFYADATGQRLSLELRNFAADPGPREVAILADQWKSFGVEVATYIIPEALRRDGEQVSAYPAFRIEQSGLTDEIPVDKIASTTGTASNIATRENRWVGNNRGGWSHPEYDRLAVLFRTALDRGERNRAAVQAWWDNVSQWRWVR